MALKKITWQLNSLGSGGVNNFPGTDIEDREYQFDQILSPYFRKAGSHCMGLDEPFVANFYFRGSFPAHGSVIEIKGTEPEDSTFYDLSNMSHGGRESALDPTSTNIKIVFNARMVGVLCPETQTLWASDWTHSKYMRTTTELIITRLAERGLLRSVSEYQEVVRAPKEPDKVVYPEYSITMGCDPEFEVVEGGRVRRATDRLGHSFDFTHPEFGNFGLDGAGDQVELRPNPGEPETVVKNIRGLLGMFGTESKGEYTITPSSDRFPCGGHIHIGVKPKPPRDYFENLAKVLDDFIGHPTKRLNGVHRGNGDYGAIHDWSDKYHGMEYRTPPGTIFRNPELGRVTLQLGYNLAYMFANTRELEYEDISWETLMSVGGLTRSDAEFYLQECAKESPTRDECLLAAWGVEVEKAKCRVSVEFGEDWSPEVQSYVRTFLDKMEPTRSIRLHFFGLAEGRGNVYTFKVKRRSKIDNHLSVVGRSDSFGFSRKFRFNGESPEKMTQILNTVMEILGIH